MKKIIVTTALAAGLVFASVGSASALIPEDEAPGSSPDCVWGELTADAIAAGFQQGQHSSSFDTPRVGLANVIQQGDLYATCVFLAE
jgi:hypothetical protein